MRTRVLNHFHTFHPEAQAELNRLAAEEARLTLALARRSESEPAEPKPKRRMSEPPASADGIEAELERFGPRWLSLGRSSRPGWCGSSSRV